MSVDGVKYWCSVCSEVHTSVAGSEEWITKTGWTFVTKEGHIHHAGEKLNIGFCNGTHSKDRPVHMHPERVMPAVVFAEK